MTTMSMDIQAVGARPLAVGDPVRVIAAVYHFCPPGTVGRVARVRPRLSPQQPELYELPGEFLFWRRELALVEHVYGSS